MNNGGCEAGMFAQRRREPEPRAKRLDHRMGNSEL